MFDRHDVRSGRVGGADGLKRHKAMTVSAPPLINRTGVLRIRFPRVIQSPIASTPRPVSMPPWWAADTGHAVL